MDFQDEEALYQTISKAMEEGKQKNGNMYLMVDIDRDVYQIEIDLLKSSRYVVMWLDETNVYFISSAGGTTYEEIPEMIATYILNEISSYLMHSKNPTLHISEWQPHMQIHINQPYYTS